MLIAYYPNGLNIGRATLSSWLTAAKAAADLVASPGIVIAVDDPRYPYSWGHVILADDRQTQGGLVYSKIHGSRRVAELEFTLGREDKSSTWESWHVATAGGRIPFVWREPMTGENVIVTAAITRATTRQQYRRIQPASLRLTEYLL